MPAPNTANSGAAQVRGHIVDYLERKIDDPSVLAMSPIQVLYMVKGFIDGGEQHERKSMAERAADREGGLGRDNPAPRKKVRK